MTAQREQQRDAADPRPGRASSPLHERDDEDQATAQRETGRPRRGATRFEEGSPEKMVVRIRHAERRRDQPLDEARGVQAPDGGLGERHSAGAHRLAGEEQRRQELDRGQRCAEREARQQLRQPSCAGQHHRENGREAGDLQLSVEDQRRERRRCEHDPPAERPRRGLDQQRDGQRQERHRRTRVVHPVHREEVAAGLPGDRADRRDQRALPPQQEVHAEPGDGEVQEHEDRRR